MIRNKLLRKKVYDRDQGVCCDCGGDIILCVPIRKVYTCRLGCRMSAPDATAHADLREPSPWSSRRLWSLWDMLAKYAFYFFAISGFLENLKRRLGLPPFNPGGPTTLLGSASASGGLLAGNNLFPPYVDKEMQNEIQETLGFLEERCKEVGILKVSDEIAWIINDLPGCDMKRAQYHIEHLSKRILSELKDPEFIYVPADKAIWYGKADLFGAKVSEKLLRVTEDISRAGDCYALGQNTACVFHLMRVMEHCVQRFGKKLKVEIDTSRESWYQIMLHVNGKVGELPGGLKSTKAQNAKKQKYALAADRLDHVRLVWRNDVMHPKATYDDKEALEVLTSVKSFLTDLAPIL